ncbi:DUF4349 domain-containing protein [Paenibacillus sabinae]|uniref:DUF4349 domain-containing protein n=1 Tax=Paenibacillus sabinae T27 TaxID=1268072 RepID=X5A399_9BACL|nr:DUF4349 domain-containing protein [Paenibacillus sabinae]AHV98284.1 hypothetical protein PSAB_16910 [Paenibacillus sabinae T27]
MIKRGLLTIVTLLLLTGTLIGCSSGRSADHADQDKQSLHSESMDSTAAESNSSSAEAPIAAGNGGSPAGAQVKGMKFGNQTSTDSANRTGNASPGGFTSGDVADGLNKKLIYHANLNMEVENYEKAQTEVRNWVNLSRGYIIGFNETVSDSEHGGTFVVKVPASGFSSFMDNLEKIKHVSLQRSIEGQDVTEEYVDLEARLKAKQMLEAQYTEFMKKAAKASDLVAFANELGQIQESIEQIKGRMRYIDQNVLYSTVELRVYQTDESSANQRLEERRSLFGKAADALRGTLNAMSTAFQWLFIFLAGALPLLIGAAFIAAVLLWLGRSRRNRRDKASLLIGEANRQREEERAASDAAGSDPGNREEKSGDEAQPPDSMDRQ